MALELFGTSYLDPEHTKEELFRMPASIEQVTQDALTLSEADRAHLAQTLLRSLDSSAEERGYDEAWSVEIARRVERVRQGMAHGRPAEDVFRDIRGRLQQ